MYGQRPLLIPLDQRRAAQAHNFEELMVAGDRLFVPRKRYVPRVDPRTCSLPFYGTTRLHFEKSRKKLGSKILTENQTCSTSLNDVMASAMAAGAVSPQ